MNNHQPHLEVHDVSKTHASVRAVDDISFTVNQREIFGLLGPNGAGKTTTVRVTLDIIKPDAGQIAVFGGPMTDALSLLMVGVGVAAGLTAVDRALV